jgi:thiol-disulfide isomerase/thioredoxin
MAARNVNEKRSPARPVESMGLTSKSKDRNSHGMGKYLLVCLFAVGCGGKPVDNTMNRSQVPIDATYPKGPYGYARNSVIFDLQLNGKTDPMGAAGTASYYGLTAEDFTLGKFHDDPAVGFVVITGAAGWCGPCREEASEVAKIAPKWEAKGVRFVTALVQGFDEQNQTPSTAGDIDKWQSITKEHITIATDPHDYLHEFSAEIASFPLNIIVRTYDMLILHQELGLDSTNPSIEPTLELYVP